MARPIKWRKIEYMPTVPYYVPIESDIPDLPENVLKLEELEAIRLKDLEGLEQGECAERMEVSRPTFQRILLSAREKVADSLINGKIIHIEGGNFTLNVCLIKCKDCGNEWNESFENFEKIKKGEYVCPNCGSANIVCNEEFKGEFCHRRCRRHRGRGMDS